MPSKYLFCVDFQELYNTIFDPIDFGFKSIKHMLKVLDQIIEIQNNVLYTKNEFKIYENDDLENENVNTQVWLKF